MRPRCDTCTFLKAKTICNNAEWFDKGYEQAFVDFDKLYEELFSTKEISGGNEQKKNEHTRNN